MWAIQMCADASAYPHTDPPAPVTQAGPAQSLRNIRCAGRVSTRLVVRAQRAGRGANWRVARMTKVLGLVGSFVGGSIGWWLGAFFGTMTAFMISIVGSGAGLYFGRWIATEYVG